MQRATNQSATQAALAEHQENSWVKLTSIAALQVKRYGLGGNNLMKFQQVLERRPGLRSAPVRVKAQPVARNQISLDPSTPSHFSLVFVTAMTQNFRDERRWR